MNKFYLVLLTFSIFYTQTARAQCDTTTSLLIDLRMDNSIADSSIYNQIVLEYGSPVFVADRHGNDSSAIQTSNGTIFLNQSISPNFKCQFPFSLSTWIYPLSIGSRNPIFLNNDHATQYGGAWVSLLPTGELIANVGDGGAAGPTSRRSVTTDMQFTANQWYHVAVVWKSETDMKVYVNGVEQTTTTSGTGGSLYYHNISGTAGKIGSGVNGSGSNAYFDGIMDDVRFWNDSLVPFQIQSIYDSNVDFIPTQTALTCLNQSVDITSPSLFCDYNWSNGGTTATNTVQGNNLGVGTHTIYANMYDAHNILYTDSIIVTVSICTGIDNTDSETATQVYPNPTTGELNITAPSSGYFTLSNVLGEMIAQFPVTKNDAFDISFLPNGLYFLTELNSGKTFKLVKE